MRIAIPVSEGILSQHFGHCAEFALIDVDPDKHEILKQTNILTPPHQPGLLPKWLAERGVNIVIAGGLGERARELFVEYEIEVILGCVAQEPEKIAVEYLTGKLALGENLCDH